MVNSDEDLVFPLSVTRVRSQGRMTVGFNVVTRDLARFGYNNCSTHTLSAAYTKPKWLV